MSSPGGLFVTFEGIEGCGKSTQLARLAARIRSVGREVVTTREPGGTSVGRALRSVLLGDHRPPPTPLCELLLYTADRAQHVAEVVVPALERGDVVLCDRYLDATLAYQGHGRGFDLDEIEALHARPPLDRRPHRTVVLDLDPEVGLARARERNEADGTEAAEGRFERERLSFHGRVRDGYLALAAAAPERFRVVDAEGSIAEVDRRVWSAVADLFDAVAGEDGR